MTARAEKTSPFSPGMNETRGAETPWTDGMKPIVFRALDPVAGGEPRGIIPEHLVHMPPAAAGLEAAIEHVKERYPTLTSKRTVI